MKIWLFVFTLKLISAVLSVLLLLISWGCTFSLAPQAFRSQLPEETRLQVITVAVVPATYIPESNFIKPEEGSISSGALYGAAKSEHLLLMPIGALIGVIVTWVDNAVRAVPADEVQKAEAAISSAISAVDIQEKLAGRMVSAGLTLKDYQFSLKSGQGPATQDEKPHYRSLKGENVDMALEVGVKSLELFGGEGNDPEISLFMDVNVRVVRTADGSEIYSGESSYISRPRRNHEWVQDDAAVLRQEFETSFVRFAEQILENLFLVHEFYVDSEMSAPKNCMLKPYNPPIIIGFLSMTPTFSKVDSLRPTFQWEAFPREKDLKFDSSGILTRINEITYDLKIWKSHNGYPEELIYDRQGLSATEEVIEITEIKERSYHLALESSTVLNVRKEQIAEHTIEMKLEPSTKYFWSVRSRFKLDGQTRVTKWSYSGVPWWTPKIGSSCLADHIPLNNYHRFKTPKKR